MMRTRMSTQSKHRELLVGALCALLLTFGGCAKTTTPAAAPTAGPKAFESPEAAAQAVYLAAKAGDTKAIVDIFGPAAQEFLISGDPTTDNQAFNAYVTQYDEMHRFGKLAEGGRVLIVGNSNYPFPFPLRKLADGRWEFDADGGRSEFLARRIGDNELTVMGVLNALAEAQVEYYSAPRDGSPPQYAQRFSSTQGKQDGLYWPVAEGQPESPLGPLAAAAAREGYPSGSGTAAPFHGYYFRMLTSQGPAAEGGARDYLVDGRMTAGFAFLAYPADYRKSGVMSFIINQDGQLYQKDFGADTASAAQAITAYDPDSGSPDCCCRRRRVR